jgi:hypothetical protein
MDRRAVFFFGASWACRELTLHTPKNLRYVGVGLAIWLAVLGIASLIDNASRRKNRPR